MYIRVRVYTRQRRETMTMRMCVCIHAYMRANGAYACAYVVSVAAVRQVRGTVDQSAVSPWPGVLNLQRPQLPASYPAGYNLPRGIVHRNKSTLAKYPLVCEKYKDPSA